MSETTLRPAAIAFDSIARDFDSRFGMWGSVAAQRRAVRKALLRQFPRSGHILEIGGGTGEDATFLATREYRILLTDASPSMVHLAQQKLAPFHSEAEVAAGEDLEAFAQRYIAEGRPLLDGAFSNFAPLNCVQDLRPVARALSMMLKPGAAAMLVVFGTCCPAEMLVEALRGRPKQMFRRFQHGPQLARLSKREFSVFYHRKPEIEVAFGGLFNLERRIGIGVAVPPSAAEPWISRHPTLLAAMETFDRLTALPLAGLADHVLYQFRRRDK